MKVIVILLWIAVAYSVKIKNRRFLDQEGREIIFHGPNVVSKVPPYMPQTTGKFNHIYSYNEEDYKMLREWGFNGVRLGMMWAGVEPTKDVYNETYLQEMLRVVNKAGEYGIYTLIDFHQDLLAEKFCGDGVPTWLMDQIHSYRTFPMPLQIKPIKLNTSGLPSWEKCNQKGWGTYYFSDDVGRAFNHLYNPRHLLNRKFTQFWKKVATVFKGNPYVIAYEIINEPFIGDFVRNPVLVIPSIAQRLKFQSFYDRISHSIRAIDPATPICIEPVTFDNTVPVGFSHAPGGKQFENSSILCYHYYKPPALGPSTVTARIKDGKRLNIASLLSEFHAGDNNEVLTMAEDNMQSWLFWDFKEFGKGWGSTDQFTSTFDPLRDDDDGLGMFNPDGTVDLKMLGQTSRTYMQRTAGYLERSSYIHATKHFSALYEAHPKGTSILYLNKALQYPNGYMLEVVPKNNPNVIIRDIEGDNYVEIQYKGQESMMIMVVVDRL